MKDKNNERKSFVMYCEWGSSFEEFTDEELGQLIRAVYAFVTKGEETSLGDRSLRIIFNTMKECFIRDGEKWDEIRQLRSEVGSKGGAPKGNKNASKAKTTQTTKTTNCLNKQPKQPVNVNGNVSVNDNVNDNADVNADVNDNINETVYADESINNAVNEDFKEDVHAPLRADRQTDYSCVEISDDEFESLSALSDRLTVARYISKISDWQVKNRKINTKPYQSVRKWLEEDGFIKPPYTQPQGSGMPDTHQSTDIPSSRRDTQWIADHIDFDKLSSDVTQQIPLK